MNEHTQPLIYIKNLKDKVIVHRLWIDGKVTKEVIKIDYQRGYNG